MSSAAAKNLLGIFSFLFGSQALHEFLRTHWFPKLEITSTAAAGKNIFHCAPVELFTPFEEGDSSKDLYYPPTYDQDGFVHLTHDPALLLNVLNHFYSSSESDWICLEIDPRPYGDKLVWEAPLPVGNIATKSDSAAKFPHIYQGLMRHTVVKTYRICRDKDTGRFASIKGLC